MTRESASATTHCPYCALQCGTHLRRTGTGVAVQPSEFPVNNGGLCRKGWTAPELLNAADRLWQPLVRGTDGALVETDWDTALDTVATRVRGVQEEHGSDSVGVFGGGLTNEKAYLLGKFARLALGTSRIDYNGRFCMSAAAAAGTAAFGVDRGLPFPVTDLAAAGAVLLAGANPADTMPPLMQHLRSPALIVIDPRRTATAESAALHLQPAPGTDLALALGLLHIAVVEGHCAEEYVRERTTGFASARSSAAAWWPERVERVTGVPAADQRAAVRMLAEAAGSYVLTGRGIEQHSNGADTATAFIDLALALGLPGTPGSGFGTLTGQGNGQGGREHGQKADQLPGYRKIDDPEARAHAAAVWGVPPTTLPGAGPPACDLLRGLGSESGCRALFVLGSNPAVSAPAAAEVTERLAQLDLLVVADFVPSETARMADVVLPVAQWAEEEGTLTNLEGRVLRRRRLRPPPEGVRTDLDVLHGVAVRLGAPGHHYPRDAETAFDELRRASQGGPADYFGVTYERLDAGEALHWPCPQLEHPGTPRMFLDGFAHPDGRARFGAVGALATVEPPDPRYPWYATTGRIVAHYQSGAQTRRIPELAGAAPEPFVEVHPDAAEHHGLAEGALARVVSATGATTARVHLVPAIRADTVFLPFHFADGGRANLITDAVVDPRCGMPEFKTTAVRLEPAEETSS